MADSYSDRLGLIGQEEGTHSNEWGDLLNLNFQRLDSAVRGYTSVDVTGGVTLDSNNITATSSVAQENSFFQFIEFTNTAGTVTVPAENIMWIVYNNTDGNLTFQPSGGTGVTLTQGEVHFVIYGSNGTTFTDVTGLIGDSNADTVTVADESSDTTCFPLFVTAATGDLAAKSGTNITFNSATGDLVLGGKINATSVELSGTDIFESIYPVGSIYYSTSATNPGTSMGFGTWGRIAEGRVLIGEGSGAGLTARTAAAEIGQEDSIVPQHNHGITDPGHNHTLTQPSTGGATYATGSQARTNAPFNTMYPTGSATTSITIDNEGVSATDGNIQPALVVYIWERTA